MEVQLDEDRINIPEIGCNYSLDILNLLQI